MPGLNKVILLGNLTRDPELRSTGRGSAVCALGLAINRRFTTASGEAREETCFVDIDVWGAQGQSCAGYLRKGARALVEGRLRLDQWQDRNTGRQRSRLKVTAERVQFLGLPRGADFGQPGQEGGHPEQATRDQPAPPPTDQEGPAGNTGAGSGSGMPRFEPINDDDGSAGAIPF